MQMNFTWVNELLMGSNASNYTSLVDAALLGMPPMRDSFNGGENQTHGCI